MLSAPFGFARFVVCRILCCTGLQFCTKKKQLLVALRLFAYLDDKALHKRVQIVSLRNWPYWKRRQKFNCIDASRESATFHLWYAGFAPWSCDFIRTIVWRHWGLSCYVQPRNVAWLTLWNSPSEIYVSYIYNKTLYEASVIYIDFVSEKQKDAIGGYHAKWILFVFQRKKRLDISCESSAGGKLTWNIKPYFLRKMKVKKWKCRLLQFLFVVKG